MGAPPSFVRQPLYESRTEPPRQAPSWAGDDPAPAYAIGRPGEVLVLDMGQPVKIVDVAERLIAESGQGIEIHFTGLRQGEKLHEVLLSDAEDRAHSAHPLISQVPVPALDPSEPPSHRRTARVEESTASLGRLTNSA